MVFNFKHKTKKANKMTSWPKRLSVRDSISYYSTIYSDSSARENPHLFCVFGSAVIELIPKQIIDPLEPAFKSDWELFSVKLHLLPLYEWRCGCGCGAAEVCHRHYDKCAWNQMMLKSMLWFIRQPDTGKRQSMSKRIQVRAESWPIRLPGEEWLDLLWLPLPQRISAVNRI